MLLAGREVLRPPRASAVHVNFLVHLQSAKGAAYKVMNMPSQTNWCATTGKQIARMHAQPSMCAQKCKHMWWTEGPRNQTTASCEVSCKDGVSDKGLLHATKT